MAGAGRRAAFEGSMLARIPRPGLVLLAALMVATMVWSVSYGRPFDAPPPAVTSIQANAPAAGAPIDGDLALYARIVARMRAGESYAPAAVSEQRAADYPLRPFVTVRLPTLAWLDAHVGQRGMQWLAGALLLTTAVAWLLARTPGAAVITRLAAAMIALLFGGLAMADNVWLIHEFWAGLFMTLSMALYRPHRLMPALIAAAAALAVREFAAPFVVLWFVMALFAGRKREAVGTGLLLAGFAIGMALHAHAVNALLLPGDRASEGWDGLLGPGRVVASLVTISPLQMLPPWLAGPLAVLPILGWMGLRGRTGWFAVLLYGGLAAMIAIFARANNFYWTQVLLPGYAIGLAFVPDALSQWRAGLRAVRA